MHRHATRTRHVRAPRGFLTAVAVASVALFGDSPSWGAGGDFNIPQVRKGVVFIKRITPGLAPASGSGFLVSKDGVIYTNRHVAVPDSDKLGASIVLVGVPSPKDPDELDYFNGEVVYAPPAKDDLDFAIVKIAARADYALQPLPLSLAKLDLGAAAAAIGYPHIQDGPPTLSFNKGSISATRVKIGEHNYYQTDAAVNVGNSGGPLINAKGEAVAIVTLKKRDARKMGYALFLSEVSAAVDKAKDLIAKSKPAAGPRDPKKLPALPLIAAKKASWEITKATVKETRESLLMDADGGPYWITSKEALPENFQLVIPCQIVGFQGKQRLQPSQFSMLRSLVVRFATEETGTNILEPKGYMIRFSHNLLLLYKEGKVLKSAQKGNDSEPFTFIIMKRGKMITLAVDGTILMEYEDANPLKGGQKFSIGGFISKLSLGPVNVIKLDDAGPKEANPNPDPNKDTKASKEEVRIGTRFEVALPAAIKDIAVGGDGRYLFMHMPDEGKLAVFDVHKGEIVKNLPLAENNVKFAAGQDKLVIALPGARELQRYNLRTFDREVAVPYPFEGNIDAMALGYASQGPLLVAGGGKLPREGIGLLHLDTFKVLPFRTKETNLRFDQVRAGGDGTSFTLFPSSGGARSRSVMTVWGTTVIMRCDESWRPIFPGPDAQYFFASNYPTADRRELSHGAVLSPGLEPIFTGPERDHWCLPAYQGPYYARCTRDSDALHLHVLGMPTPFLTLTDTKMKGWGDRDDFMRADKRVFLIPQARRIVLLSEGNNRLVVYTIDFEREVENCGAAKLVVLSTPPSSAMRGKMYDYQVRVHSKAGGVRFKLQSGPPGMELAADGRLTWKPAASAGAEASVKITITDDAGLDLVHRFNITVRPGADAPPEINTFATDTKLPSPVKDLAVGGGGRYLFLHLPKDRKLTIYDVAENRFVKDISVPEDAIRFAAGQSKLVIALPQARILQRWDLKTLEREALLPFPFDGDIKAMALGSASAGPVLVIGGGDLPLPGGAFLDLATLKPLRIKGDIKFSEDQVRAAANGSVFTLWSNGNGGRRIVTLKDHVATMSYDAIASQAGQLFPRADGRLIFGHQFQLRKQVHTRDGVVMSPNFKLLHRGEPIKDGRHFVPAAQGPYYASLRFQNRLAEVDLHLWGVSASFLNIEEIELNNYENRGIQNDLELFVDKRLLLLPAAKRIVVIPRQNDRLIVYDIDLESALAQSEAASLAVVSVPPADVRKGTTYDYAIKVYSKAGGVTYKLEAGPDGMAVSPDGKLTWKVPADFADKRTDVILSIRDKTGREVLHSFSLGDDAPKALEPPAGGEGLH